MTCVQCTPYNYLARLAFFQIPIEECDIKKTCITTTLGAFEYLRMNFGLCGAAQSFQRFIDMVIRDVVITNPDGSTRHPTLFAYVDDILVASENTETHEADLRALFTQLGKYNLRLNLLKCEFGKCSLDFFRSSNLGISPLPEKSFCCEGFPST